MLTFPGNKPQALGTVRARLGISLRESHDFLMRNPYDWEERLEAAASNKTSYWVSPEDKIRDLIQEHWRTGSSPLKLIEDIAEVLVISRPTTR